MMGTVTYTQLVAYLTARMGSTVFMSFYKVGMDRFRGLEVA